MPVGGAQDTDSSWADGGVGGSGGSLNLLRVGDQTWGWLTVMATLKSPGGGVGLKDPPADTTVAVTPGRRGTDAGRMLHDDPTSHTTEPLPLSPNWPSSLSPQE